MDDIDLVGGVAQRLARRERLPGEPDWYAIADALHDAVGREKRHRQDWSGPAEPGDEWHLAQAIGKAFTGEPS